MAFNAATVWEVRTTGSDTNGGGFVTGTVGGTDYSQQDSPQATGTVTSSGTTVTATTGIFTSAMVGNYITDGTTWKQITFYTSSTIVTVDSAPSWFATAIKIGGALGSPGTAAGLKVAGNTVYIKYNASPYSISSPSANVSGGVVNDTTAQSDGVADYWIGYDTTRTVKNTDANKPVLQVAASGVTSVSVFRIASPSSVSNALVRNLVIDGQSKTGIRGFDCATGNASIVLDSCAANNCTNSGFVSSSGFAVWKGCFATGCSSQPAFYVLTTSTILIACRASANTVTGFQLDNSQAAVVVGCISDSNSGGSSDGFNGGQVVGGKLMSCTSYGNGRDGFRWPSGNERVGIGAINCLAYGNGGYGYNNSGGCPVTNYNCAGGSNTGGNESGVTQSFNFVTLTADPFVNSAGGNYALNITAGGGAACRAAGFPGVFPGGTTTGNPDIGAAQHADAPAPANPSQLVLTPTSTY